MRAERGELGYQTNLNDLYHLVDEIGRGAFGVVSRVRHKASTRGFACKSIAKEQTPGIDDQKEQEHFEKLWLMSGCWSDLRCARGGASDLKPASPIRLPARLSCCMEMRCARWGPSDSTPSALM